MRNFSKPCRISQKAKKPKNLYMVYQSNFQSSHLPLQAHPKMSINIYTLSCYLCSINLLSRFSPHTALEFHYFLSALYVLSITVTTLAGIITKLFLSENSASFGANFSEYSLSRKTSRIFSSDSASRTTMPS